MKLRDDLKSISDRNKKSYLREDFQKHAKNSKDKQIQINQILNNKKSGCDNIYLSENGILITDPKQMTNKFNNYFVTVAEKLTKNPNEYSMYLTGIESNEIKTQIKIYTTKKQMISLVYQQIFRSLQVTKLFSH